MEGQLYTASGLDPSLRHGALVSITMMRDGDNLEIIRVGLCYSWNPRSALTVTEKTPIDQVDLLGSRVANNIDRTSRLLAVDYDERAAYWTRRPAQVAKLTYLTGYILGRSGLPIVHLSPDDVRDALRVSKKAEKVKVWEEFTRQSGYTALTVFTSDVKDAVILAYLGMKRHTDEHHPSAIVVPSGNPSAHNAREAIAQAPPATRSLG